MRTLTQLNFVVVSKENSANALCAQDKGGMKGVMVFYTERDADAFITENGMRGAMISRRITGIPDLWVLGGLGQTPYFCCMEKERGKFEGEFFPFSQFPECQRIDNPALITDPMARDMARWAREKWG